MAKKKKKKSKRVAAPKPKAGPKSVQVMVALEVPEGTPTFYANFIEIGHNKWDFSLLAARLPTKNSAARIQQVQETGVLSLAADMTLTFPTTLVAGLIRALTIQKEKYEQDNNTVLTTEGIPDEPVGQTEKRNGRRRRLH